MRKGKMKIPSEKQPEFVTMTATPTIEAASDEKQLPRFRMVAYTGGVMRIEGFPRPVVVDLAGLEIPNQNIPIRLDHERRQGVGHRATGDGAIRTGPRCEFTQKKQAVVHRLQAVGAKNLRCVIL